MVTISELKDDISGSVEIENKETIDKRERVSEDKDIEKECMKYETVDDYFVCEIDKLVEIERDGACNLIEVTVDTPYDEGTWEFKKPYGWNDDNPLVKLCESRNYSRGNFTSIAGDKVLVTRKGYEWVMDTNPPEHYENNSDVSPDSSQRDDAPNLGSYFSSPDSSRLERDDAPNPRLFLTMMIVLIIIATLLVFAV